ncbi:MAG TPA: flagellar biosynthetic protein FliO [Geodermatophilus sp.]|nr:flagellar biosynthetic protein FliO [Geodermatophilus sp.]
MTWMIIRLVLSLVFVAAVLWFAARVAQKRGLGQGNGLIEVVARQRMGRASSVNVVRIAGRVLVVGATEEQVTLLAEVDGDAVEATLRERRDALRRTVVTDATGAEVPALPPRTSTGVLAGSVFDRSGWSALVQQLRERTVRR